MVHREHIAYLNKDTLSLEDLFCLTYCTIDDYYATICASWQTPLLPIKASLVKN